MSFDIDAFTGVLAYPCDACGKLFELDESPLHLPCVTRAELVDAIKATSDLKLVDNLQDRILAALVRAQAELAYLGRRQQGHDADENVIRACLVSLRNWGKLPWEKFRG